MVATVEQSHCPLHEPHTTSKMERGIPLTITDQRVSISLEEVLDHFVLACKDGQVEGGLFEIVEAINDRGFCRGKLRKNIQ